MSENIQETTATENANENSSKQEVKTRWEQQLGGFEEFKIAVDTLINWTNELSDKTLGEVFESKAKKTAPFSYQMLAILTHQSSGYVGDKWQKAKTDALKKCMEAGTQYDERETITDFILDQLAPNLAELRAEKEKARLARIGAWNTLVNSVMSAVESVEDTWNEFEIEVNVGTFRKMFPKYQQKQNGMDIFKTLMYRNLNAEDVKTLTGEHAEIAEAYSMDYSDIDQVPEDFQA